MRGGGGGSHFHPILIGKLCFCFCAAALVNTATLLFESMTMNSQMSSIQRSNVEEAAVTQNTQSPSPSKSEVSSYSSQTSKFLDPKSLKHLDIFAAAWWQSRDRFLKAPLGRIDNVEGDVWAPVVRNGRGIEDARLTLDWLDFSLEHLSKWQKMFPTSVGDALAEEACRAYVREYRGELVDTYMNTTIAVVPFGVPDDLPPSTLTAWMTYLAATLTSLAQHAPKRIVVVGHYDTDATLAARAFRRIGARGADTSPKNLHSYEYRLILGDNDDVITELAYVHTDNVKTKFIDKNVPYGALVGLQYALKHGDIAQEGYKGAFLGQHHTPKHFEYVYMTESDQILQARLSPIFWEELQQGRVIIPHRLQPIPHRQDLVYHNVSLGKNVRLFFPDKHPAPIAVQDTDACCDDPHYYGQKLCDSFWWQCGYSVYANPKNFSHFENLDFMTLEMGTGIVSLAGNEHGRRCRVKLGGRGTCS